MGLFTKENVFLVLTIMSVLSANQIWAYNHLSSLSPKRRKRIFVLECIFAVIFGCLYWYFKR